MEFAPLRLTLRQLSVFVAVARSGSTTAAAQSLALSQSAVSAALAELENALKTRLFDRAAKRLAINEMGRQLLPRALSLLDQARELERFAMHSGVQIRIAASNTIGSYLLPPLLAGFRAAQDGPCSLDLYIGNTQDVLNILLRLEADIGLIEGACHEPSLRSVHWCDDDMVIVTAPSHLLAALRGRTQAAGAQAAAGQPAEGASKNAAGNIVGNATEGGTDSAAGNAAVAEALRSADWVVRERGSGTRELIEQRLVPYLGDLRFALQLGNSEAIKHAVMSGFGVSCLSAHVVRTELASGLLVALEPRDTGLPSLVRPLHLVVHQDKYPTQGLLAFSDFLRRMAPTGAAAAVSQGQIACGS